MLLHNILGTYMHAFWEPNTQTHRIDFWYEASFLAFYDSLTAKTERSLSELK